MAAGDTIGSHRHDDHQIVYAGRGVLTVTTTAGSWVAPANRAIWVPSGTVHTHRAHGDVELHLIGLRTDENPLGLTDPAVLAVSPLLRELIVAYTSGENATADERTRMRAVLFDQLCVSRQEPLHLPTPSDPMLLAVCRMLEVDLGADRTLSDLGRELGASTRSLSRRFRRDLGMTFPQWRTQLRLHHALIMLAEGEPVTAVAHRCGWSSASAFIDVFRRALGYTPGSYTKSR